MDSISTERLIVSERRSALALNHKERTKTKKKQKRKKEKWTTHNFPRNGVSTAVWAGYWELAAARNVFLKEMRLFRTIFLHCWH